MLVGNNKRAVKATASFLVMPVSNPQESRQTLAKVLEMISVTALARANRVALKLFCENLMSIRIQ